MSMIGNYLRLPEIELQRVLRAPESISELLYPEDDSELPAERQLDTDKAWHLTHFLLTSESWGGAAPLCYAVLGGAEIGKEDVGYGPARYLTATQVREVAEALAEISSEELWRRFDAKKVRNADIYPDGWEGNATDRDYIVNHFNGLKAFFAIAAGDHDAMIFYIN